MERLSNSPARMANKRESQVLNPDSLDHAFFFFKLN